MGLFKRKRIKDYLAEIGDIPIEKAIEKDTTNEIEALNEPLMKAENEEKPAPAKESLFSKLSRSLHKTKDGILGKLSTVFSSEKIDEETLERLEEALYTSDIGVKTTEKILAELRKKISSGEKIDSLKEQIKLIIIGMLKQPPAEEKFTAKPHVVLVVGVNGNGKTTTIGKMAHYYQKRGLKVLIGAADTFRAAAIEQLEEWAKRSGAEFVKNQMNSDPAAVAYDSYKAGESRGADVVLIDTAGRLHNKVNLMNELEKISRVLKKLNPEAPHEVLLVLDATTGQNALSQAKQFGKTSGVTGIVLTKLDGTAKGGVTIAINQEMDIPVKFIGIGEKIDDLEKFDPEMFVRSIFE